METQRVQMKGIPSLVGSLRSQSTYIPRVYHSVCHSSELGPPTPSPASVCVPPGHKGQGTQSPAGEVVGGPNSDDWIKSLALCLLCGRARRAGTRYFYPAQPIIINLYVPIAQQPGQATVQATVQGRLSLKVCLRFG